MTESRPLGSGSDSRSVRIGRVVQIPTLLGCARGHFVARLSYDFISKFLGAVFLTCRRFRQ